MGIVGDRAIWEAESRGIELLDLTIGELFDRQCEANADKEALVYNYPEIGLDLRLTYRQYQEEVNRLAKGLLALGIEKGEHVAVWATNLPEWVMLEVALAKIGAVLVTVNTNCRVSSWQSNCSINGSSSTLCCSSSICIARSKLFNPTYFRSSLSTSDHCRRA